MTKIGYNVITKTYKDIHNNDVVILLNRKSFNDKSEKIFNEKTFWERTVSIVKTGAKNLITELIVSIPLILKCILGYAVASGFEQAIENPECITDGQNNVLKAMDKTNKELNSKEIELDENGKVKKNSNFYTIEESMEIINRNMNPSANKGAGAFNEFARSEIMKNAKARDQKTGELVNVYGAHYNKTNHGAADISNGTRTIFNGKKYETEKLSDTEYLYEIQKQCGKIGDEIFAL